MLAMQDKQQLRQRFRAKRKRLTAKQQQTAAKKLTLLFTNTDFFKKNQYIAVYLATDGEIDPLFIIEQAWRLGKQCFLPVLVPKAKNQLYFIYYGPETPLVENKYGIPEPVINQAHIIKPSDLDVVLLPLVAFDEQGHRLGRGAGFYDRTFGATEQCNKPRLIGLAHDFQQVACLPTSHWDVSLDATITEKMIYEFN